VTPLLTRRDRAALALACVCVRRSAEDALDALAHSSLRLWHPPMRTQASDLHSPEVAAWLREHRFYRARLALWIRALLRADAGDTRARIRPLWELAGGAKP
jgi:hypothetical protein